MTDDKQVNKLSVYTIYSQKHTSDDLQACGRGCAGLGGESPHASSYAGYLLLVMVTLLAHGRRGVMMEDGAR